MSVENNPYGVGGRVLPRRSVLVFAGLAAALAAAAGTGACLGSRRAGDSGSKKEVGVKPTPTSSPEAKTGSVGAATEPVTKERNTPKSVTYPATVWRNGKPEKDSRYDVVFDPSQGGSSDHAPYGWWYQPNLPSAEKRESFEVAIILPEGRYRITGPECRVYWNNDGKHPFDQGQLVVDRQNGKVTLNATEGHGHEAWLFVKGNGGAAGGFSFERLEPMPE